MAKILLIETATEVCGAAIAVDGQIVSIQEVAQATSHAALLTLQIDACARDSGILLRDLDAVAVSSGPGSYTTLRVGTAVAKGICYALGKPLIAVSTLQALAAASREELRRNYFNIYETGPIFAPMIDARRMEVCTALFDLDLQVVFPEKPMQLENNMFENWFLENGHDQKTKWLIFSGNGIEKSKHVLSSKNTVFLDIQQSSVAHMAVLSHDLFNDNDYQSLIYFEPKYMKPPNITSTRNTYF